MADERKNPHTRKRGPGREHKPGNGLRGSKGEATRTIEGNKRPRFSGAKGLR